MILLFRYLFIKLFILIWVENISIILIVLFVLLFFKKFLGIGFDTLLINILKLSPELCDFCRFRKVPDSSQFSRFRKNYAPFIFEMFNKLVEITEPICREINKKKADYLIYNTTGFESYVAENNPKFFNSKLKQAKKFSKTNDSNPYIAVYSILPSLKLILRFANNILMVIFAML